LRERFSEKHGPARTGPTPASRDASVVLARRLKRVGKRLLPEGIQEWIRASRRNVWPPVGFVRFGSFRRLRPISGVSGWDRGVPIDRYYIADFLRRHAGSEGYMQGDIRGRVLEIGDDLYTREFGGWEGVPRRSGGVEKVDVLSVDPGSAEATIVADLTTGEAIPSATFDCVICTQTLLLVYDVRAAVRTLHRILKPDGVLLATFPGISRICRPEIDVWGDYWRFTTLSARRLFEEVFPPGAVSVEAYGNVLSAIAFLHGLAAEDLKPAELDLRDPNYEVLIAVRARKSMPSA
jgi:SAM-dependent methyltransferase